MSNPVEAAIRRTIREGMTLHTSARGKPFAVEALGPDGLNLGLGDKRWTAFTPWAVIGLQRGCPLRVRLRDDWGAG